MTAGSSDPGARAGKDDAARRIVLASNNAGKLAELQALLAPLGVAVRTQGSLGIAAADEPHETFLENALAKARHAARLSGLPALADDSGFCVAALGGQPGVVSARWAGPARDFAAAMARVQRELGAAVDRRAWFACALCLAWPDGATASFFARADGTAIWPPRGGHGFGYDPMFVPVGHTQSYGEMAPAQKHTISHRARAFAQFVAACLR